ncbi:MAG TPA: RDD family protein [Thermodesulfovibrionales bacterium]|nr:RDD family protein [Thermodesulfovibrionales bacterium]
MSDGVKRAGLLLRIFAKVLDFIVIAAVAEIVPKAGFYAGLAYLLISDGLFEGRGIGKLLIGLRVVSTEHNEPCTVKESIVRNAFLGAGLLPYKIPLIGSWIGWIFILLVCAVEFLILLGSKEGMRLGDEFARTTVVETVKRKIEQEA